MECVLCSCGSIISLKMLLRSHHGTSQNDLDEMYIVPQCVKDGITVLRCASDLLVMDDCLCFDCFTDN